MWCGLVIRGQNDEIVSNTKLMKHERDGENVAHQTAWRESARKCEKAAPQTHNTLSKEGPTCLTTTEQEFREAQEHLKHRQTEQALRQSEEMFRALNACSPVGVFVADAEGCLVYVNPRWREIFKLSFMQAVGDGWLKAVHPADRQKVLSSWKTDLTAGRAHDMEYRLQHPDGVIRWIHARALPRHSEDTTNREYVGIVEDITDRKKTLESLRETNEQLQKALQDLKQAQAKMLEQERLRIVGQMASGIAHDFNNALAPILGFCELLRNHADLRRNDAKLCEFLDLMFAAAKDAAETVRRLRELYRNHDPAERTLVNLNRLAQQAVTLTEPRWKQEAAASGITIECDLDLQPVPDILGNESALRETLTNLILNAVDAMPQGGTIRLKTRADNRSVVLEVTDTGVGMSEETVRRCFEPFFTTKGKTGTGLGLATAKAIVQSHGGEITVASQPSKGATFTLRFPLPTHRAHDRDQRAAATFPRGLRVLLVDDEAPARRVYTEFLQQDGHEVVTAKNGPEGLAAAARQAFDLVISDMAMIEMSGEQFATRLQEIAPGTPVILLTGFGDLIKERRQKPDGVAAVLNKPATWQSLRAAVREALAKTAKGKE